MDIQKILGSLGVEANNSGAAIGAKWLTTSGNQIISSPVDGQVIGTVTAATEKEYETCIQLLEALAIGECYLHLKEEK